MAHHKSQDRKIEKREKLFIPVILFLLFLSEIYHNRMRKNNKNKTEKMKPNFSLLSIDQARQKQELILFVESNLKTRKEKQTRNDSCYCPPLNTHTKEKMKRTYCNILIKNHRPRHRQRDSVVCTKYCFVMLKIERDCMRDKALLRERGKVILKDKTTRFAPSKLSQIYTVLEICRGFVLNKMNCRNLDYLILL